MTAGRRYGVMICRIVRPPDVMHALAADIGPDAICVCCPALLEPPPAALAVVEGPAGIRLTAGICAECAAQSDHQLITAAYKAYKSLTALATSLRPIGTEGSA